MRLEKRSRGIRRRLPLIAVVAILVGLVLFQCSLSKRKPSLVNVAAISPLMNFSTVRVEGTLEDDARSLRDGSVLYVINDGTGIIPVFEHATTKGSLPLAGSRVSAVGHLTIGAGNQVRMRARVGARVIVLEKPKVDALVPGFKLADITADRDGERTTVYGRVVRMWNPDADSKAPYRIVLVDSSGSLDVVHWLEKKPDITVGDAVEVHGTVEVYQGRVQLKVWRADAVRIFEKSPSKVGKMNASER